MCRKALTKRNQIERVTGERFLIIGTESIVENYFAFHVLSALFISTS